jgi:AcrR family transcriptional regulator
MSRRQRLERTPDEAPTREKVLAEAMVVLAEDGFDRFSVQRVLDGAEISRATLYRHFSDVDGLIEAAMVETFRQQVDVYLGVSRQLVEESTDLQSFRQGLKRLLDAFSELPAQVRVQRAHTLVLGTSRPQFGEAVAAVQESLTDGWEEVIRSAQGRGFVRKELDPRAPAVVIQAFSLGRIIDDAAATRMSNASWAQIFFEFFDRAFLVNSD